MRSKPVLDGAVTVEPEDKGSALIEGFQARFTYGASSGWWWEHLSGPSHSVPYSGGDGSEGLRLLADALDGHPGPLHLVLPEDWPNGNVATGSADDLVGALSDSPFMESAIFPPSLDWAVPDTHHNVLIILGEPHRPGSVDVH